MKSTLTINLPAKLRRWVARAAKQQDITEDELVRRAVQEKMWRDTLDETRRKLVPKARAMGIFTDEDVFREFSS